MKRFLFVAIVGLPLLLTACQAGPAPTPTETATSEPIIESTAIPTLPSTWTPTSEPSPTPADTPTPAATPTPVPNDVWVEAVNGLNLRAEAKADAKVVAALKYKQHLAAIAAAVGPDAGGITWQNVRTDDGQTGWASAQFLTRTNPAGPTPVPTTAAPAASTGEAWVIAADGLNLRAQAAANSTLVALLPFGAHLALTGAPAGPDAGGITWQNVRADDGKTGFVSAQFISPTKPATRTPTATAPVTTTAASAATTSATTTTPAATTPATTTTSTGNVYVIAANGLNLRAQPNSTATVIANLTYGQRLTALAPKSAPDAGGVAWQNVRTDANQTGWAAADYLSATPPVTATATITSAGAPVTAVANDLLRRINELRAQNRLQAVSLNTPLTAAAQGHSQDMAKTGNISHTGSDNSTPEQRMRAAGYVGGTGEEVIYGGRASADDAWYFWTNDRTHANILLTPEYTAVGISVINVGDRSYYTLDFGKP
jgi:uncharacterized protein YkwD